MCQRRSQEGKWCDFRFPLRRFRCALFVDYKLNMMFSYLRRLLLTHLDLDGCVWKGQKCQEGARSSPSYATQRNYDKKVSLTPFFRENDFLYVLFTCLRKEVTKVFSCFKTCYWLLSHINFRSARSARRKPVLKGDSTESSNPFYVSDDEDTYNEDSEKFDQSFKGESLRNHAKAKEDVVLPEWLVELPEDLEVGHYVLGQLDLFSPSLIRP